jgi:hypothetical protein
MLNSRIKMVNKLSQVSTETLPCEQETSEKHDPENSVSGRCRLEQSLSTFGYIYVVYFFCIVSMPISLWIPER